MAEQAADSKISLVSKSDIRYEGFLHFINADENTVGLKNVRMLGTEGRKGVPSLEVAANDQMYDFIIFRGSDIKDLTVYEAPQVHQDPAIVSATPAARSAAVPQQGGRGGAPAIPQPRGNSYAERAAPRPASMTVQAGADRRDDRRFPAPQSNNNNNAPMGGGRGGYSGGGGGYRGAMEHRGGYGGRGGGRGGYRGGNNNNNGGYGSTAPRRVHTGQDFTAASAEVKEQFKEDFDFDKAKDAFEKRRAEAKDEGRVNAVRSYDKKSFFDTISCESKDPKGRQDRDETKRADAETFGTEMVSSLRPFRRGRGGRGRYHSRF